MMIWTARFSRKRAVFSILLMAAVMLILLLLTHRAPDEPEAAAPQLITNQERVEYLESFGWQVESEPLETLQFLLPEPLEEPYLSYNTLQMAQGFDLSLCCGKQISRYTYAVTNYPGRESGVQANLYICEQQPVAGDIFCPGANGFQTTLVFPGNPEQTA